MKNKNVKSIVAIALAATMCASLIGCGQSQTASLENESADGGVLKLAVNPEISITYDNDGKVSDLEGLNEDGNEILKAYTEFKEKECKEVASELVEAIGEAGYFKPDENGKINDVVLTIEEGSVLPSDDFINEIAEEIRISISLNEWHSPVNVEGESDYGLSDYADTDYGTGNDGVTDYDDNDSKYDKKTSSGKTTTKVTVNDSDYNDSAYDDGDSDYKSTTKPSATKPSAAKPSTNSSDYNSNSGYDSDSGYDKDSGYDSDSGYDKDSGYDSDSAYGSDSGYDKDSGYDSDSGYDKDSAYDDDSSDYGDSDYDD